MPDYRKARTAGYRKARAVAPNFPQPRPGVPTPPRPQPLPGFSASQAAPAKQASRNDRWNAPRQNLGQMLDFRDRASPDFPGFERRYQDPYRTPKRKVPIVPPTPVPAPVRPPGGWGPPPEGGGAKRRTFDTNETRRSSGYEPTRQYRIDPRLAEYQQQRNMMQDFTAQQQRDNMQGWLDQRDFGGYDDPRRKVPPPGVSPYAGQDPRVLAFQQARDQAEALRAKQRSNYEPMQQYQLDPDRIRMQRLAEQQDQLRSVGPPAYDYDRLEQRPQQPLQRQYETFEPRSPYADFEEPNAPFDLQQFNKTIRDLEWYDPQSEPEPYRLSPWGPNLDFLNPEPEPEPAYRPQPWGPDFDLYNMLRGY